MPRFNNDNEHNDVQNRHTQEHAQGQSEISRGARSRAEGASYYINLREQEQAAKKKTILQRTLITIGIIVAVGVAVGAFIFNSLPQFNTVNDEGLSTELTREAPGDPFYMLLLGIDKSGIRANVLGQGDDYHNYRADTIILARGDPKTPRLTLISIHRDTLVNLGNNGQQKINAAYALGGPSYMTKVVSEFAGVPISHYAEIDFDGFLGIIDTLGGIDVNLPIDVIDEKYAMGNLKAGPHHLDADDALFLARARHAYDAYGDGDSYRAANQRMIITAVIKKILASNPAQWPTLINDMTQYVKVDPGLTSQTIMSLAWQMQNLNASTDIYTGMEPTTSKYTNNIWYEICNVPAWQKMMKRVNEGLPPYENESQDKTRGVAAEAEGDSQGSSDVTPIKSGKVVVMNASNINGIAGNLASKLNASGFTANASNANFKKDSCLIVYNNGHEGKAAGAQEVLGSKFSVTKNDGSYPTDVDIVVVVGGNYQ